MPRTESVRRHPQTPPARARSRPEPAGGDIPAEDWDLMLDAVTARLRMHTTVPRAVMLDCAAALEQLRAALRHTRAPGPPQHYDGFDPLDLLDALDAKP